jgi:hypothetical protein
MVSAAADHGQFVDDDWSVDLSASIWLAFRGWNA